MVLMTFFSHTDAASTQNGPMFFFIHHFTLYSISKVYIRFHCEMLAIWSSIVIDPKFTSFEGFVCKCISIDYSACHVFPYMYDSLRLNNSSYHVDYRWIECNYCTSHGIQSSIDTLFVYHFIATCVLCSFEVIDSGKLLWIIQTCSFLSVLRTQSIDSNLFVTHIHLWITFPSKYHYIHLLIFIKLNFFFT